jgi:thiamine biosynthesis lipoprotein
VKKPLSIKDTFIALKNNDNFIIIVEIIVISLLVAALVFIVAGNKNGSQGGLGNSGNGGGSDSGVPKQSYTYNAIVEYFNTSVTVIGYEATQDEFAKVSQEAVDLLGEYHRLFDIYNEYDGIVNLCTLNKLVDGQHQKLKVDRRIIDMLLYAKEMYTLTDGRMNVAMGSVLSIWHDYRDAGSLQPVDAQLPPMDKLTEAAKHTDINSIVIDEVNSTVWISDPYTKLDVGAIAKGYAVERVAEMLEKNEKTSYALNIGGNIRTIGYKGNGDKWKTGIRDPKGDMYDYNEYVALVNESIVTSGSYERYYIVYTGANCRECDWIYYQNIGIPEQGVSPGTRPGKLTSSVRCPDCGSKIRRTSEEFHHIIDRETLMPADRGYLSVSVICKDSGMGDGLSTALFCMDLDEALAFVNSLDGVEAMFVTEDEVKHYSNGFKNYTFEP